MKYALLTLAVALGPAMLYAPETGAQQAPSTAAKPARPAPATADFLTKVAAGNTFEIESSKLALGKNQSKRVVDFANMMIKDHGEAGAKFKKAVTEAKLTPPPDAMDAKHKTLHEQLSKKQGADFEKAYIDAQHDGHVETVSLFEAYAAGGDNARMKQFAQELLPTLRTHLDHVHKMK
jgi:putative membrane protein